MSGHGSAPADDKANHPGRKVDRPASKNLFRRQSLWLGPPESRSAQDLNATRYPDDA